MLTPQGTLERPSRGPAPGFWRRLGSVALVLVVLASGAFAAWWFLVRDAPAGKSTVACPPSPSAAAKLPPPVAARTVRMNVYNATDRSGLAGAVSAVMAQRGFRVVTVANDPAGRRVTAAAEVRHGPRGLAAARTVAAHVDGQVVLVPDRRPDASVDLVVGAAWRAARTPAAAAAALTAMAPKPAPAKPGAAKPGTSKPVAPAPSKPAGC